jgi:hypothetical protein
VQYVVLTDEFIAKISERVIAKQRENALWK